MNFREWLASRGLDFVSLDATRRVDLFQEYVRAEGLEDAFRGTGGEPDSPDDFARAAAITPQSLDEKSRSVDGVIATERPVPVLDFRSFSIVDEVLRMDGVTLPPARQVPLLDVHDRWSVEKQLGSTRNIHVSGSELVGTNVFSAAAESSWTKVREGHVTDFSVGYGVSNYTEIPPGQSGVVGGKTYKAGKRALRITTKWHLRENSLCPIGADFKAKVRSAFAGHGKGRAMDPRFREWLSGRGITEEQYNALPEADRQARTQEWERSVAATGSTPVVAPPAPAPAPAAPAVPPVVAPVVPPATPPAPAAGGDTRADGARAERERQTAIRAEAEGLGLDAAIVQRALEGDVSVDAARQTFLTAVRSGRAASVGAPGIIDRSQDRETAVRAMAAGFVLRSGLDLPDLEGRVGILPGARPASREDMTRFLEEGHRYRDTSLLEMCREACSLEGITAPRGRDELIRRAFSTMTLTNILGNVAHKSLIAGYFSAPNTSLAWIQTVEVPDFKEHTFARLSDSSDLEEVPPGGEINHGEFSEWAEKEALRTFAKRFSVTRQDIINDDLRALAQIPSKMGAAARRLIDDRVYTVLLSNPTLASDSVALFHATHANYDASSGALADATLAAAKTKMRKQTDLGGSPLNLEPRFLIACPELEHTAAKLINSQEILKVGDDESYYGTFNPHKGKFALIIDPRISNTGYTGYDVDSWYLAASPDQCGTMVGMFLSGKREPTVEQVPMDAAVLGVGYRVFFDFEAAVEDFRGMYLSKGA